MAICYHAGQSHDGNAEVCFGGWLPLDSCCLLYEVRLCVPEELILVSVSLCAGKQRSPQLKEHFPPRQHREAQGEHRGGAHKSRRLLPEGRGGAS